MKNQLCIFRPEIPHGSLKVEKKKGTAPGCLKNTRNKHGSHLVNRKPSFILESLLLKCLLSI